MAEIEQLARRRIELQQSILAIRSYNYYGKTTDELTEVEILRIKTQKELNSVIAKITDYEREPGDV